MSEVKSLNVMHLESTLFQESTQTHTVHSFYVPVNTNKLVIHFDYDPIMVEGEVHKKAILKEALQYYQKLQEDDVKDASFRNLLTLSIDDPEKFRGAAHRSVATQFIVLSEEEVTAGFWQGSIQEGLWSITVSAHAILSPKVFYRLRVEAIGNYPKELNRTRLWHNHQGLQEVVANKQPIESIQSMMSYRWVPCELHTHTNHSDGKQSLLEMAQAAKSLGIEVIAMTDHNTISPLQESEAISEETGMTIINGLEWTTFYGHLLTLGYETPQYSDWRIVGPSDMAAGIKAIHDLGALVGIAHPYRSGNPFCTGCYFEYEIEDLQAFDYIEVWNSENPALNLLNQKAFALWTGLLNKGYRLPAISGRDWHHNETENPIIAKTFLAIDETQPMKKEALILLSLKQGRASISLGGAVEMYISEGNSIVSIGESYTTSDSNIPVQVILPATDSWHPSIDLSTIVVKIESNLGSLYEMECEEEEVEISCQSEQVRWIRAEAWGKIKGQLVIVAFTNPIYIDIEK